MSERFNFPKTELPIHPHKYICIHSHQIANLKPFSNLQCLINRLKPVAHIIVFYSFFSSAFNVCIMLTNKKPWMEIQNHHFKSYMWLFQYAEAQLDYIDDYSMVARVNWVRPIKRIHNQCNKDKIRKNWIIRQINNQRQHPRICLRQCHPLVITAAACNRAVLLDRRLHH